MEWHGDRSFFRAVGTATRSDTQGNGGGGGRSLRAIATGNVETSIGYLIVSIIHRM